MYLAVTIWFGVVSHTVDTMIHLEKVIDDTYAIVNKCLTNEIENITHVGAMHMSFTQSIT